MNFKLQACGAFFIIAYLTASHQDAYGQPQNCKTVKNGVFKIVDGKTGTSYINRNGIRQAELTEGSKDSSVFVVEWISDCTYTLTPTKETMKRFSYLPNDAMMTIQIIEIRDSSYLQISSANFDDMGLINEVIKIW